MSILSSLSTCARDLAARGNAIEAPSDNLATLSRSQVRPVSNSLSGSMKADAPACRGRAVPSNVLRVFHQARSVSLCATILLVLLSIGVAAPAPAFQQTTAEYSADYQMESAEGATKGKIYSAPHKERREFTQDGETMVMITRQDKKTIWTLMPNDRVYMELALGDQQGGTENLSQYEIEQTDVGKEVVNGVQTTKSKIVMKGMNPKLGKMGGFWWTTAEGIVMKMDVIAVDKKDKSRIKMELTKLTIGKQDSALFEIPSGYTKMSMGMPGMGAMGGGDQEKDDGGKESAGGAQEKKGFGLSDALKLLK